MNEIQTSAKVQYLTALCKVQGTIGAAKKDSQNPHFKNSYASLESVNETVMGPLNEAGFVLMQGGVDIGGKPYLQTTLFHSGGHSESFVYPLIENDGNPQHMGSATTYARRYSICALLNLSTEDDDAESASSSVRTVTREPARAGAQSAGSPANSGGDFVRFVPKSVVFAPGKGKGANKTFSKITSPEGVTYAGNELQGQIAESAMKSNNQIVLAFTNSSFGPKATNVKMVAGSDEIEEVPF